MLNWIFELKELKIKSPFFWISFYIHKHKLISRSKTYIFLSLYWRHWIVTKCYAYYASRIIWRIFFCVALNNSERYLILWWDFKDLKPIGRIQHHIRYINNVTLCCSEGNRKTYALLYAIFLTQFINIVPWIIIFFNLFCLLM